MSSAECRVRNCNTRDGDTVQSDCISWAMMQWFHCSVVGVLFLSGVGKIEGPGAGPKLTFKGGGGDQNTLIL